MASMTPPPMIDSGPSRGKPKTALWVVLGLVGCAVIVCGGGGILMAILFPVFAQAREAARTTACVRNLERSARALAIYASDHDDKYPAGDVWMDAALSRGGVNERSLRCPVARNADRNAYGYAFNKAMSKQETAKINDPTKTLLIFDSTLLTRNAVGDLSSAPVPGRHIRSGKGNNVAYADEHVSFVRDGSR
jgi:hypothetical protein